MGCFGCFHGSASTVKDDDALLPWAPLPGEGSARGWRGARGSSARAPAFGEGALRPDPWSPKHKQASPMKRPGRSHHDPFAESAAAASARAASPPAQPARTPFAASAAPAAEGGWQSEPGWVRERAQALAAEAAAAQGEKPKSSSSGGGVLGHLFSRQRSGGENDGRQDSAGSGGISLSAPPQPPKGRQARAGASRQKQHKGGQEQLLPRAPAFGQGALTKWH